ncbi:MAG TPA: DUF1707 domain-containing protein [Polyangia bacterium]|nr:DUF1707 domain-containing protein [Polyangia bacterium]
MSSPPESRLSRPRAHEARERVIATLQEHFAHDVLDVDEFERRVTLAHQAEDVASIEAIAADLPVLADVPAPVPRAALVPAADVRPTQTVLGIMSSTERRGAWVVPRRLRVRATMSSTVLDFRDARLPAGPVEIQIRAVMSSVEIIVPPGLAVDVGGAASAVAILGSFEHVDRAPAHPDPDAPLLRVTGLAVMSSVEIKMRLAGESEPAARRRVKAERRAERKALPPQT